MYYLINLYIFVGLITLVYYGKPFENTYSLNSMLLCCNKFIICTPFFLRFVALTGLHCLTNYYATRGLKIYCSKMIECYLHLSDACMMCLAHARMQCCPIVCSIIIGNWVSLCYTTPCYYFTATERQWHVVIQVIPHFLLMKSCIFLKTN